MKKIAFILLAVVTACSPETPPDPPATLPPQEKTVEEVSPPAVPEPVSPPPPEASPPAVVKSPGPALAPAPKAVPQEKLPPATINRFTVKEYGTVQGKVDLTSRTVVLTLPFGASLKTLTPVWTTDAQGVTWQGQKVGNGRFSLDLSVPQTLVLSNAQGLESVWTITALNSPPNLDTRLTAIELGGAVLDPPFSPDVQSYSLLLSSTQKELPVSALPSFGKSKIYVQMNDSLSPQVLEPRQPVKLALKEGENNLFLKVVAEDGKTTKYYVVVIKRR